MLDSGIVQTRRFTSMWLDSGSPCRNDGLPVFVYHDDRSGVGTQKDGATFAQGYQPPRPVLLFGLATRTPPGPSPHTCALLEVRKPGIGGCWRHGSRCCCYGCPVGCCCGWRSGNCRVCCCSTTRRAAPGQPVLAAPGLKFNTVRGFCANRQPNGPLRQPIVQRIRIGGC